MLLMLSSLNILIDFLLRNRAAKVLNGVKAAVFAALCLAMLPHYTVGFPWGYCITPWQGEENRVR